MQSIFEKEDAGVLSAYVPRLLCFLFLAAYEVHGVQKGKVLFTWVLRTSYSSFKADLSSTFSMY